MLFNSFGFLVFFPAVFLLHWWLARGSAKAQNVLLLLASMFFYASADARSLLLLLGCAAVNFLLGQRMADTTSERGKSVLFWTGIVFNTGLLCLFKYFGFFRAGVVALLSAFGLHADGPALTLLLPLGMSFLVFQMLSYLIDVKNEEIAPSRKPLHFVLYVLYFPKILAGPVERAQRFLPQVAVPRVFDPALVADGFRQVLWGFFAKVVIADHADVYVDSVFDATWHQPGSALLLGAFLYFVQLYCDFSGYSNIAIGVSKMLGIRLMANFATPFFATDPSDFWKRWHISLTSWMMEYLFTPLSFILRGLGRWGTVISISVIFFTVGIWHGANWAFVLFGALQSLYFLPLAFANTINRPAPFPMDRLLPTPAQAVSMLGVFTLMMFSFILLRTEDVPHTLRIVGGIFSGSLFHLPGKMPLVLLSFVLFFVLFEWMQRDEEHALRFLRSRMPAPARVLLCYVLAFTALWYGGSQNEFIYFQF
jgi:alginate O-acetyltransferase complex protein AlgI